MAENKEEESSKRVIYTYPMVKQTDMPDDMKVKLLETPIRYNLKCHISSISLVNNFNRQIYWYFLLLNPRTTDTQ